MSQNQSSYKVIVQGPMTIGNALVRKDDIVKLTSAQASRYSGFIKRVKTPAQKPAESEDTKTTPVKTPPKSVEHTAKK